MKRLLVLGLLSLAGLDLCLPQASAFFCCRKWRRCCGMTQITCRPYNAFTPICWGNLVCDGCCPSMGNFHGGGCGPMGCGPMGCGPMGYGPMMGGWGESPLLAGGDVSCTPGSPGCLPSPTSTTIVPATPPTPGAAPAPGAPSFTPPPPAPSTTYYNPYAGYGLQRAGYYPGYYGYRPAYNYAAAYQYNPYWANPYAGYGYNPYQGYGR